MVLSTTWGIALSLGGSEMCELFLEKQKLGTGGRRIDSKRMSGGTPRRLKERKGRNRNYWGLGREREWERA